MKMRRPMTHVKMAMWQGLNSHISHGERSVRQCSPHACFTRNPCGTGHGCRAFHTILVPGCGAMGSEIPCCRARVIPGIPGCVDPARQSACTDTRLQGHEIPCWEDNPSRAYRSLGTPLEKPCMAATARLRVVSPMPYSRTGVAHKPHCMALGLAAMGACPTLCLYALVLPPDRTTWH